MAKFSQAQKENIQIDYGIVYLNYGEINKSLLGPSKGGGEFNVDVKIRDIEFDGARGKEKGMQVVETVDSDLKVSVKDTSIKTLALAMPWATLTGAGTVESPYELTCENINIGVIAETSYLKNVTMFAKTLKGEYRQITLYNAMHEGGFSFKATPKGEAEIELDFNAHWDPMDDAKDLYDIKTISTIVTI